MKFKDFNYKLHVLNFLVATFINANKQKWPDQHKQKTKACIIHNTNIK